MQSKQSLSLLCVLALAACTSIPSAPPTKEQLQQVAAAKCPTLPPIPPELQQPAAQDYLTRLLRALSPSGENATLLQPDTTAPLKN